MNMETIDSNLDNGSELQISPEVKAYILEMARWGKILAIIGFVGMAIMIIALIFGVSAMSVFSGAETSGMQSGAMTGMYVGVIVFSVLYVIPLLYLYKGSIALKKSIDFQTQDDLNTGFSNYKSLFKFIGIFTIIIMSFYALALIIGLIAAM